MSEKATIHCRVCAGIGKVKLAYLYNNTCVLHGSYPAGVRLRCPLCYGTGKIRAALDSALRLLIGSLDGITVDYRDFVKLRLMFSESRKHN
jgi:hypothetical protein